MIKRVTTVEYVDQELDRHSCIVLFKVQDLPDRIGMSICIATNGDIDTDFSIDKTKEIADSLYKAIEEVITEDSVRKEVADIQSINEEHKTKSFAKIYKVRNNCVEMDLEYEEPDGSTDIETYMTVDSARELADAIYDTIDILVHDIY